MFDTQLHAEAILKARYKNLINAVPLAIMTALCAIAIQIVAFKDRLDWQLGVLYPLLRMSVGIVILGMWVRYQKAVPTAQTAQQRIQGIGLLMMISGLLNLHRCWLLLPITSSSDHYFLLFHTTIYGFCFAFILRRIGLFAYLFNLLFIAAAFLIVVNGQIAHRADLGALLCLFEGGVLIAMHSANQAFDRLVSAKVETQLLLDENRRLANLDSLTQLSNRRHFFMRLESALAQAKLSGQALSVGMIDLDHFKPVNDQLGHHIGDGVLQVIGERLLQLQSPTISFYRIGGDEFAFIVLGEAQDSVLHTLTARIQQRISQTIAIEPHAIVLGASIGVSRFAHDDANCQTLYEQADSALYQAKKQSNAGDKLFIHLPARAPNAISHA